MLNLFDLFATCTMDDFPSSMKLDLFPLLFIDLCTIFHTLFLKNNVPMVVTRKFNEARKYHNDQRLQLTSHTFVNLIPHKFQIFKNSDFSKV